MHTIPSTVVLRMQYRSRHGWDFTHGFIFQNNKALTQDEITGALKEIFNRTIIARYYSIPDIALGENEFFPATKASDSPYTRLVKIEFNVYKEDSETGKTTTCISEVVFALNNPDIVQARWQHSLQLALATLKKQLSLLQGMTGAEELNLPGSQYGQKQSSRMSAYKKPSLPVWEIYQAPQTVTLLMVWENANESYGRMCFHFYNETALTKGEIMEALEEILMVSIVAAYYCIPNIATNMNEFLPKRRTYHNPYSHVEDIGFDLDIPEDEKCEGDICFVIESIKNPEKIIERRLLKKKEAIRKLKKTMRRLETKAAW
ncbi:MAG TPA: hypothetical protein VFW07_03100 [Parafilimonas sp.]|nr:hypothetical protein [Parafilimonas sp.]